MMNVVLGTTSCFAATGQTQTLLQKNRWNKPDMTDAYCQVGDMCWPLEDIPNLRRSLSSPDALIDGTEAQQLVALQAWCTRNGSHEKQYNGGHYVPALPNGTCEAIVDRREKFGVFWRSYTMNVVHYSTPGLIVQAKTVQDIMHAFNFARKHNIRLAVRNTGHAYNGQSSANGGIVVLMSDFQSITVNPGENPTITVGGGCTWGPVYQAANDAGYVSTGGHDPTVGVVGCMIGACHGEFTRQFGYTADLVTSMTVVVPGLKEAQVMEVNSKSHPELFWAIRGSGGGFGAIVEATIKIFPAPPAPVITTWQVVGPDNVSQGAMCPQLRGKTAEQQEVWWNEKGPDGGAAQLRKWLWSPAWMKSLPWGWAGSFTACSATLMYCGYNLTEDLESEAVKEMIAAAGPGAKLVPTGEYEQQVDYHLAHPDNANWIPQVFLGYVPTLQELPANSVAQAAVFGSGLAEPLAGYESTGNYTRYPVQRGQFTYYPAGYMDVLGLVHGGKANTPPPGGNAVGLIRKAAGWQYVMGYGTTETPERKKYEMVNTMAEMIYPTVRASYNLEWVAQASYNKFGMERFWEAADIRKLENIHKKHDPCNILWVARGIGHNQPHCAAALI